MLGRRRGLVAALRAEGIEHYVERAPDRRGLLASLAGLGSFSHVIAGTEAAVVPAAHARESLAALRFPRAVARRCHDKLHMKRWLSRRGIPMTPFLDGSADVPPAAVVEALGLPVVLKERKRSGGRGLRLLDDLAAVAAAPRRGRILERRVEAPEASVESFVCAGAIRFESVTEYLRQGEVNVVPAAIDDAARAELLDLNRRVLRALGVIRGMTHLEAFLTPDGPLFGEVALRPPGGYIMDLLRLAWRFDAWRAFVAAELDRPFDSPAAPSAHAAAVILHPGPGTVSAVRGLDDVRRHPCVVDARVKVAPGDRVAERAGLGQDVGRVLLRARTRGELLTALEFMSSSLRIEIRRESR